MGGWFLFMAHQGGGGTPAFTGQPDAGWRSKDQPTTFRSKDQPTVWRAK